ncbi:MAG: tRNA uridine-5-carboxymethylaminomethyl(34) synthesis GTPase MnmE [Alphaproteobacteria bacterium]|nr:tRNA uridine-5-carboxymethylaminomethyl(34) synthesis GTPase MnmE [Alphaproteobacteria bacterium]MBU0798900.1 tRNA uridine-5-carboxymethylaminomethyl(34) synthesis GTPase MnmE [Alphaproteobacteria bacterium]MBU0886288.1 tRNA uridine-5-carboxymethylaminomethyl(34) synthesis GTPase MnmE [Alphaproteobacteria bacterium]MBU1813516.1 tRNA uridine-5-carboxymethylaminomethyl(34) synthesis GTPase MnmE [Alphaproteobacteria bacterium]MBU2089159.1 tRNA uridine-5-carboxymethylaminomethyl(34) synthesis GT
MTGQTIFALASAPGRAGIAVLRVSGPDAGMALQQLTGRVLPEARQASRRRLVDPATQEVLDEALVLWFPAPHSFTGEDVAELHLHGSRAVIDGVSGALADLPGVRLAEPGEFTRRAFLAGKLDLTEVEGLADLIDAETSAQRRLALRQMDGALSGLYEGWRQRLMGCLAHMEAAIDFPDEELPDDLISGVAAKTQSLRAEMAAHLADGRRGEILRDGFRIAIIGAPNAGKSSLLNWLARREAAIVSETAGTTRDVIEVHLDLGGYPVVLADTAGLRDTTDSIEAEGIRRARRWAEAADLQLLVIDSTRPEPAEAEGSARVLRVWNKVDLYMQGHTEKTAPMNAIPVSVGTGQGLPELLATLSDIVGKALSIGVAPVLTRERHRRAIEESVSALDRFLDAGMVDLAAEDLRVAMRALGRIKGRVDVEDLLDVIFRDFCLGK